MKHLQDILWTCLELLKAGHSADEVFNRLFAPEKVLAGAISLKDIETTRKDYAKLLVNGMSYDPEITITQIQEKLNANGSPWKDALTAEEIQEVLSWTPSGRQAIIHETVGDEANEQVRMDILKAHLPDEVARYRLKNKRKSEAEVYQDLIVQGFTPFARIFRNQISPVDFHPIFEQSSEIVRKIESAPPAV